MGKMDSSPPNWYKANFDAAIFDDVGRVGLGVIIRDSQGLAMFALTQNAQLTSLVVEMEALPATQAVEFAAEIGLDRVIFEGDSSIVIRGLTDQGPSFAPFGFLIKEALGLANQLTNVKFQHVGREGNSVAHNLARHARYVTGFSVLMEDVPSFCFEMY
nr:uncharacterized protein LOC111991340 [Quercus suber]